MIESPNYGEWSSEIVQKLKSLQDRDFAWHSADKAYDYEAYPLATMDFDPAVKKRLPPITRDAFDSESWWKIRRISLTPNDLGKIVLTTYVIGEGQIVDVQEVNVPYILLEERNDGSIEVVDSENDNESIIGEYTAAVTQDYGYIFNALYDLDNPIQQNESIEYGSASAQLSSEQAIEQREASVERFTEELLEKVIELRDLAKEILLQAKEQGIYTELPEGDLFQILEHITRVVINDERSQLVDLGQMIMEFNALREKIKVPNLQFLVNVDKNGTITLHFSAHR